MGTDIANWLQVNIVNNPQVLQSLIALIILIVASFLFSEKTTEKNLFRSRRVWGALLYVFAIFVFLYANIADLADVFTVWATLVLAGVAIFSFEESRRLRKQYSEREERDKKVQLLNDIINWAEDLAGCSFLVKTQERHPADNLLQRHRYLASKETYIRKIVLFFENEELNNALPRILDNKGSLINLIDGLQVLNNIDIESEGKNKLLESETDTAKLAILSLEMAKLSVSSASEWMNLMPIGQKLYEDVTNLIEHASNLKIKLISEF